MDYIQEKTNLLNPRNVLRRGYAVTFKNSKVLKEASSLNKGDIIKTVFFKGSAHSRVERIGEDYEY